MKQLRVLLCIVALTAASAAEEVEDLRKYMDAAAQTDKFSGTVLITRKNAVVFKNAYGLANREKNRRNTLDTSFRIGSMTKSLTAVAIMTLRDQSRVKLEDNVCVYLQPCPEAWNAVKLQHLLTHTAGMPDLTKFPDFMTFRTEPHTPAQLVAMIAAKPLDFTPGSKFVYSNSNFLVLGAIIEKVSGMSYAEFMRKHVFGPAAMSGSGYEDISGKALAKGYVRDENGYRTADASAQSVRFSAGGLFSTAPDLQRLVNALAKGKLLKNSTVDEIWTDRGNQYGYGWFVDNENRRREVGHNGRIDGYASSFRHFRDEDLFLAVLSNTQGTNTERMIQALSAITHGEPFKMPREHKFVTVPGDVLEQYVGKYKLPWGLVLVVTREGDQLFGRAEQEKKPTEWRAESATRFYLPPADIQMEFKKDEAGGFRLNFDGTADAVRVKD